VPSLCSCEVIHFQFNFCIFLSLVLLGDSSEVFCLGAISSSIVIDLVVVSYKVCKVFYKLFGCSHLLVSLCSKGMLVWGSLEG
jgi:hypothetical protein